MRDRIVEEVWRLRDEYAARFNDNREAIYADLKRREVESGGGFVRAAPDCETSD